MLNSDVSLESMNSSCSHRHFFKELQLLVDTAINHVPSHGALIANIFCTIVKVYHFHKTG